MGGSNQFVGYSANEGAVVTAYNYQLQKIASEKTDKNGFAVMEAKAKSKPFLLLAEYNNQKSFVRALEGEGAVCQPLRCRRERNPERIEGIRLW